MDIEKPIYLAGGSGLRKLRVSILLQCLLPLEKISLGLGECNATVSCPGQLWPADQLRPSPSCGSIKSLTPHMPCRVGLSRATLAGKIAPAALLHQLI